MWDEQRLRAPSKTWRTSSNTSGVSRGVGQGLGGRAITHDQTQKQEHAWGMCSRQRPELMLQMCKKGQSSRECGVWPLLLEPWVHWRIVNTENWSAWKLLKKHLTKSWQKRRCHWHGGWWEQVEQKLLRKKDLQYATVVEGLGCKVRQI